MLNGNNLHLHIDDFRWEFDDVNEHPTRIPPSPTHVGNTIQPPRFQHPLLLISLFIFAVASHDKFPRPDSCYLSKECIKCFPFENQSTWPSIFRSSLCFYLLLEAVAPWCWDFLVVGVAMVRLFSIFFISR